MGRCAHRLSTGKLCQRHPDDGKRYCWQHKSQTGGNIKRSSIPLPINGEWTVYGRGSTCPYTRAAVKYLDDLGEKYAFHDTDAMGILPGQSISLIREMLGSRVKNHQTVPMIFNRKSLFIGGFSDLQSKLRG
jgi:glutaredoxin